MKAPAGLRTEYMENPIGIDAVPPRLSWVDLADGRSVKQYAYQILVASDPKLLQPGKADKWDSGRVESDNSVFIPYEGKRLASRERCYWTVRVWDSTGGKPSAFAKAAFFEMGLLRASDWKAKWIGQPHPAPVYRDANWIWYPEPEKDDETRYFPIELSVTNPRSATLYITADNYFEVSVNGQKVGQTTPKHNEWMTVERYDITKLLKLGINRLNIRAHNKNGPAGVLYCLDVQESNGTEVQVLSNAQSVASKEPDGPAADAKIVAPYGGGSWGVIPDPPAPAPEMQKAFSTDKKVVSARAYVTALGSYQLRINGQKVGPGVLTPDWTDYRKRISYQSYDVTPLIKQGQNTINALVGDGWYASALGWGPGRRFNFGPAPVRLLAQVEIVYVDGTTQTIATDGTWNTAPSPVLKAEIYDGETYDATKVNPTNWSPAAEYDAPAGAAIVAQRSPLIEITETLKPITITTPKEGAYIFDLGQNMVGWARLKVKGPKGTTVQLRFAEMLQPDGTIYRTNLRTAQQTDTYILKGGGTEVFEPHFTYHGFRYVEVTGFPGKPGLDAIEGLVLHSATPPAGTFECSDPLVNRLWLNTVWGQRGNTHSVPTDCPQRDERLGWMGDANCFAITSMFNADMASFYSKWMHDVVDAQSPAGGFSDVSPRVVDLADGAPVWGCAGVAVPWAAYQMYGDQKIVEENYDAMAKWIEYIRSVNPDNLWMKRRNNDFGDWVAAGSDTPKDVIATAWYAHDAWMMAQMADVVGKSKDAATYRALFDAIREAFNKKFVTADGKITGETQTCYALALSFNLLPGTVRVQAEKWLVEDIKNRGWHLSTGFIGTTFLMPALTAAGRGDVAYRLLLQKTYPSWLYPVTQGATTIWERWDGWLPDKGFQDPGMNSFNHYAFGAIGEWLFQSVAGINFSRPGFSEITIKPVIGEGLTYAKATYQSIRGEIRCGWAVKDGELTLDVSIPANTTATIYVPTSDVASVRETGKPVGAKEEDGCLVVDVGSGTYRFTATR